MTDTVQLIAFSQLGWAAFFLNFSSRKHTVGNIMDRTKANANCSRRFSVAIARLQVLKDVVLGIFANRLHGDQKTAKISKKKEKKMSIVFPGEPEF